MFVILATQEAEISRIMVQGQPWQIVLIPYLKNTHPDDSNEMISGKPHFQPL
jgi:hypothetical protein